MANHTFKEYEQSCNEQFYLSELLQITWCIFAKQKYGKATDLSIVTYENVFDYSYDFESILIEKGLERKIRLCFNTFLKYRKLPVVYLNIHNRHIVFISRWKEVPNHTFKEYEQSCKEQFYLSELLQITWCIFAKQKYGKATYLSIVTYENVFDYSYDFESILIEKGLE